MRRFVILLALSAALACATTPVSPYTGYHKAVSAYDEDLKAGKINNSDWLGISDRLLIQHFSGDFRIPDFINKRREIYDLVERGQMTKEQGSLEIATAFLKIKEETESRFYAQQINLRYAEVMQDIQTKGLTAQSIAGDVGIIGGLALGVVIHR